MEEHFVFDPLLFKVPVGAVKREESVKFFVESNATDAEVSLMVKPDGDFPYEKNLMKKTQKGYKITKKFIKKGHYWYYFEVKSQDKTLFLCRTDDNFSYISENKGDDFFVAVLGEGYSYDGLLAGGVIYQIMTDRFAKVGESPIREPFVYREDWGGSLKKLTSDPAKLNLEVFGGNIRGIISKLDYIKSLGVTFLYLNPICLANSNHKYDTANYMQIDTMLGTESDFAELIKKAKDMNIGIVFDGVYNHTGSDSIYFNKCKRYDSVGAYNSKKSKYFEWYNFEEYPDKYKSWWGIDTLPSIRHGCESFQDYIAGKGGVIEKYMKLGCSGVRLDVVDEITDTFVKKISDCVKQFGKNKIVMGEVWEDAATKISYGARRKYFCDNELNSVMNYPIKDALLCYLTTKNPYQFVSTVRMLKNNYPRQVVHNLMNFLGTHDTKRIFSELTDCCGGDEKRALSMLKIAFVILFTTFGTPSIFYGDEQAMKNNDGSSRGCFDWSKTNTEMVEFVKKLSAIRKKEVFKFGDMNIIESSNGKLIFERITNSEIKSATAERVLTMVNLRESPLNVEFEGKFVSLLSNEKLTARRLVYLDFDIVEEIK